MGKFFEAMQRAAKSQDSPSISRDSEDLKSVPPHFEEGDVRREGPESDDAFPDGEGSTASQPVGNRTGRSPEKRKEPYIREVAVSPQVDSARDGDTPPGDMPGISAEESSQRNPFSTAKLVDSGVFRSPVYAAYERVVQRLLRFRKTPRQSLILVASAMEGEGASTVARNTALALGRHETEQVLLVDANCRKPAQHEAFGIDREIGLSDVLMGVVPLTSAIKGDDASDISVITAGSKVPSPAQLLTTSALQGVLTGMLSLFDWVIVDGPPLTGYPDSASIAAACGGAVLVIGAESTRSEVVEEAKRVLEATEIDLLGAVLNRRRYHIPGFIYRRL